MDHLDKFILNVRSLGYTVVVSSKSSSTNKYVADTYLTTTIRLTVITGKALNHHTSILVLLAHKYAFVGDEYVVEYNKSFVTTEGIVTEVDVCTLFHLTSIAALATINHDDTGSVAFDGERNSVSLIFFFHCLSRHDEMFVRIHSTRLVSLSTTYYDTIRTDLCNMQEHVGVGLL